MKQKERISRNPLNFGDMANFLLRIAKYETSCEAARGDLGRIQFAAGNLMGQIYKTVQTYGGMRSRKRSFATSFWRYKRSFARNTAKNSFVISRRRS